MTHFRAIDRVKERTKKGVAGRAVRVLGWRYWPFVLALTAIALSLPAVSTGLLADDFAQRALLIGASPFIERLSPSGLAPEGSGRLGPVLSDLFVAVDPETNLERLRTYGALPWWTYEQYRVAFWRPLPSFTHWLDCRFFPDTVELMHFHSILWFAAVMFVVAALYRRFITAGWIAGLAGLMFLLDDSSYFPTMWLANRNLLMSLVFGLLAIMAHDRWRRRGAVGGAAMAPACLLVSLLCAEAGVATFAYLFAYEVVLQRGPWRRRGAALLPSVAVIVLWRAMYNLQGYGAGGGGFYFDPVREPIGYAWVVVKRAPFLLGGQWTTVPPDLHNFLPPGDRTALWAALAVSSVLLPVILLPLLRANRQARFWLLGMYAAALPFCATVPMSRSLLFVAVGAFGLIAEFLGGWLRKEAWVPKSGWLRRLGAVVFIAFTLAHLPLAAAQRIGAPAVTSTMREQVAETTDLGRLDDVAHQDLVVLNAPDPASFLHAPFLRAYQGKPLPRSMRILAPAFDWVYVFRTGQRRLVVKSLSQSLMDCQHGERMDFVFFYKYLSDVRGPSHPLEAGWRIALPRMAVEVLAVDEKGSPVEVAFEFDVPLDDPSLRWLRWDWTKDIYEPFEVPPVGGSARYAGPF